MKKNSTPCLHKTKKTEQMTSRDEVKAPSVKTLNILTQFARVYQAGSQKHPELCSFVIN